MVCLVALSAVFSNRPARRRAALDVLRVLFGQDRRASPEPGADAASPSREVT
jgi:hypothetical protein